MWWWLLGELAWAGVHVVTFGESVEAIAEGLGAPERAAEIRTRNGIPPGAQPTPGTVLDLPPDIAAGDCQPAYLKSWTGAVGVLVPGEPAWRPAVDRALLPVGSRVCTKEGGFATVRLSVDLGASAWDDVTLMPNTCLTVRGSYARTGHRTSLVTLNQGEITVGESAPGTGDVAVQTDAGITLGRDGGFRVAVEDRETDATRTEAVGADVVTLAQGIQRDVPLGFGSRTVVGEAPGEAVALLPAPIPATPEADAVLDRPDFTWSRVEGAVGYDVELSTTSDFDGIFRAFDASQPWWYPRTFNLLVDVPSIYWRVTAHDELGFTGVPSAERRVRLPSELRP